MMVDKGRVGSLGRTAYIRRVWISVEILDLIVLRTVCLANISNH